jgi:predicted DNA-binding protein YlxM (UPF0122 family)
MNSIEISVIRSWLDNKSIEQIAKDHKIYQSQVAEILEKIVPRFNTIESTVKLLEEVGIAKEVYQKFTRKIPKTYKTDEYDY